MIQDGATLGVPVVVHIFQEAEVAVEATAIVIGAGGLL